MQKPNPESLSSSPNIGGNDLRAAFEEFKRENQNLKNPLGTFTLKMALAKKNIDGSANYNFYKNLDAATRDMLDAEMLEIKKNLGLTNEEQTASQRGTEQVLKGFTKLEAVGKAHTALPAPAQQPNVAPSGRVNSLGRPCLGTASGLSLTSLRLGLAQEKEPGQKPLAGTLCLGDSITYNAGRYLRRAGASVQAFPGEGVLDENGPLWTAFATLIAGKKAKPDKYPEIHTVSILAGVNNIGSSTDSVFAKLKKMYQMARGAGLRVVACTLTPFDDRAAAVEKLNKLIRAEAGRPAERRTVDAVVDLHAAMEAARATDVKKNLGVGLLHPKAAGSALLAHTLADEIAKLG